MYPSGVLPPLDGRSLESACRDETDRIVAAMEQTVDSWIASLPDQVEREMLRARLARLSPLERLVALKWCPLEAAVRKLADQLMPVQPAKPRSFSWPYLY
jgi:hypothetical protein